MRLMKANKMKNARTADGATHSNFNCRKFGAHVIVYDLVGKYGDWLFKQPLLLGLKKDGFQISVSKNPHPPFIITTSNVQHSRRQVAQWSLVFTQKDYDGVDSSFAKRDATVIEIQRTDRSVEIVRVWKRGVRTHARSFTAVHEQERVRAIAKYLHISYEERQINVAKPKGRVIAVNTNVGDRDRDRLNFDFREVGRVIRTLRACGYTFRVLKNVLDTGIIPPAFYAQFKRSEIVVTRSFREACRVTDDCDFYFGADSGLAHYAVECGKLVFSLYSADYHGQQPIFQSTFRNHLCYFGDRLFADRLLFDLQRLELAYADKELILQIRRFLRSGRGISQNPYENEQKVFALCIAFISQNGRCKDLAREIYVHSANIFFTDEVVKVDIRELRPLSGKLFINSEACARALCKHIVLKPNSKEIDLYAKPCSFFYGTAMRDGSSDVDLPTLFIRNDVSSAPSLLGGIKAVLERYGFSTELPHQTPVFLKKQRTIKSLRPIIEKGRLAYASCCQTDKNNFQKYKARIKLKIIAGEVSKSERRVLDNSLKTTGDGKRLLLEIIALERDRRFFRKWISFVRKITRATRMLGDFGLKGHIFLKVRKRDCRSTAAAIGGLMRHGIVYAIGTRLYLVWDIRRPQHGWFQPITILAEDMAVFRKEIARVLRSSIYLPPPFNTLQLLSSGKLAPAAAVLLLASTEPLLFMEAYRYVTLHRLEFGDSRIFSRQELREYVREKESNCNNPRDRKLSLWSLATGNPLPLLPKDVRRLTKYNCFVQLFTTGGTLFNISDTDFFRAKSQVNTSAMDFTDQFKERIIQLLREYYLYTLATGLPREFLYEKRKEILFVYCVQGRVLLEGPHAQSARAVIFLRELNIMSVFYDERVLRETIVKYPLRTNQLKTEFLFIWLMRYEKLGKKLIDCGSTKRRHR